MDIDLQKRVNKALDELRNISIENIDFDCMDPVAKMMFIALINESRKIQDSVDYAIDRIIERLYSDFIPYEKTGAVPAIAVIKPTFTEEDNGNKENEDKEGKKELTLTLEGEHPFTYSHNSSDAKRKLKYFPLFRTQLIPYDDLYIITPSKITWSKGSQDICTKMPNCMWVGISTKADIESLQGMSLMISGTDGKLPEHIYVGAGNRSVEFSSMREMENIGMAKPFDAQQSSGKFFSFMRAWKENLLNMKDTSLLYITGRENNIDLFERAYPKIFNQWLEVEYLNQFEEAKVLWLQLEFPKGYVVPDSGPNESLKIDINMLPVVNVEINSLTLKPGKPIAKLQGPDNSFFLQILEVNADSQKQGYNINEEDFIVRDFDASCYHSGDLYRDIRNLCNRFIDDYYVFKDYHGIDDEELRQLRDSINTLAKSVGDKNIKHKYDSGTYVMKKFPLKTQTIVRYITTPGEIGNFPQKGETMENGNLPTIKEAKVILSGMGGADKVPVETRRAQLRYYALTDDRLYTKMDIDAFLRKEISEKYGKKDSERISIMISVEGVGGKNNLQRGLSIEICFKDAQNYDEARRSAFDSLLKQKIENKSCISMPIIVSLKNLEN